MAWPRDSGRLRHAILFVAGGAGLAAVVLQYGTYLGRGGGRAVLWLTVLAVAGYLLELGLAVLGPGPRREILRLRRPAAILAAVAAAAAAWLLIEGGGGPLSGLLAHRSSRPALLVLGHLYAIGNLILNLLALPGHLAQRRVRPGAAFLLLFVLLIGGGASLLLLPRAAPPTEPLAPVDALFTATSAVCVTGLVVRDTGLELTRFGQAVVLLLIQLGGLGIMSLTATVSWALGRGAGIRETAFLREVFQVASLADVGRTLRFIVLMTLTAEAVGTGLLYVGFGGGLPPGHDRLFDAVFHSVSAFCNAGFSTLPGSLAEWSADPTVVGTVAGLLVVGGLGFTVVANLGAFLAGRLSRRRRGSRASLSAQTRVMLFLTALLLLGGTLGLALLEWDQAFAARPWAERLGLAFFQSATARTAGFNTVPMEALGEPALFLLMVLMFLGAGPGSTAGGIKLTTVAVLWASLVALARGHEHPQLVGREVRHEVTRRALVVLAAGLAALTAGIMALLVTEGAGFLETAFEAVSALGTVGLSLGLTPDLSATGRVVVVLLMFTGRLGPITVAYGLARPERARGVRHPEARIMVG